VTNQVLHSGHKGCIGHCEVVVQSGIGIPTQLVWIMKEKKPTVSMTWPKELKPTLIIYFWVILIHIVGNPNNSDERTRQKRSRDKVLHCIIHFTMQKPKLSKENCFPFSQVSPCHKHQLRKKKLP